MNKARFLMIALILTLVLVCPGIHISGTVSATKTGNYTSNYAPGEVIVKLKPGASELQLGDQDERLMTIARLSGDKGGALSSRSAETLVRAAAMPRVSEIISGRGLDRVFVLKFDASAKMVSAANGADRKPQHSTPPVPPSAPLECSPSPECSCAWSSAASSPPSLQPRWPGSSSRWRPGSFGGS